MSLFPVPLGLFPGHIPADCPPRPQFPHSPHKHASPRSSPTPPSWLSKPPHPLPPHPLTLSPTSPLHLPDLQVTNTHDVPGQVLIQQQVDRELLVPRTLLVAVDQ